jgi:hypothetical protein
MEIVSCVEFRTPQWVQILQVICHCVMLRISCVWVGVVRLSLLVLSEKNTYLPKVLELVVCERESTLPAGSQRGSVIYSCVIHQAVRR